MYKLSTLFLAACLSTSAQAVTFKGNDTICQNFAETAYDVSQMRDAGVSWDVFQPWISSNLALAKDNPQSYIKDASDVQYVLSSFKLIYDDVKLTPDVASLRLYNDCMKTKAGFQLLKGGKAGKSKPKKT